RGGQPAAADPRGLRVVLQRRQRRPVVHDPVCPPVRGRIGHVVPAFSFRNRGWSRGSRITSTSTPPGRGLPSSASSNASGGWPCRTQPSPSIGPPPSRPL